MRGGLGDDPPVRPARNDTLYGDMGATTTSRRRGLVMRWTAVFGHDTLLGGIRFRDTLPRRQWAMTFFMPVEVMMRCMVGAGQDELRGRYG